MTQLKVGVFGAGMIAQIEHVPNLLHLKEKFAVLRVADPSAMARAFIEERFGLATCGTLEELMNEKLDVLLVAAPDFAHYGAIRRGLEAGLHVFTEKPLPSAMLNSLLSAPIDSRDLNQAAGLIRQLIETNPDTCCLASRRFMVSG